MGTEPRIFLAIRAVPVWPAGLRRIHPAWRPCVPHRMGMAGVGLVAAG